MTTHMIQCFEVLCETRNFTKAAERLYISQSSLSKQLKNLETELDCQLIDRTQTPIAPTPAGVRFQEYCHRVNRLHRDLIADLRPYQRCPERVLRIASIPLMVDYGAVRCITSFQAANPALKIEFSEGSQLAAQQALEDHTADVAIIRTETLDLSLYDSILISEDELMCVCNSASPFAQRSTIHLLRQLFGPACILDPDLPAGRFYTKYHPDRQQGQCSVRCSQRKRQRGRCPAARRTGAELQGPLPYHPDSAG